MVDSAKRVIGSLGVNPVIKYGYCVGCGACAGLKDTSYRMITTPYGTLEAEQFKNLNEDMELLTGRVCPFSDISLDEDQISSELFKNSSVHKKIGRYINTYAGYALEGNYRQLGSSGGMGTWILEQLLYLGYVDAIVHVGLQDNVRNENMYGYRISHTIDELRKGAKSKYYPVTLDKIVATVRNEPGRYAFVGVPCFIKAIRLLSKEDPSFGKSVLYCLGLICGHMKSSRFAEFLSWQMGITPDKLEFFDFRVKLKNRPANKYGVLATGIINGKYQENLESMENLFGKDWGLGLFKINACDYCDDVVAETADVTVGDAWLPEYIDNSKGTNILIVRNSLIVDLINKGILNKSIFMEDISPDDIVKSQGSGFSHRREGLSYRLWLSDSKKRWRPIKRTQPEVRVYGEEFEAKHRLRLSIAKLSHEAYLVAKDNNDITIFFKIIEPLSEKYSNLSRTTIKRIIAKLKQTLLRFKKKSEIEML